MTPAWALRLFLASLRLHRLPRVLQCSVIYDLEFLTAAIKYSRYLRFFHLAPCGIHSRLVMHPPEIAPLLPLA